jgi:hypothetical protein
MPMRHFDAVIVGAGPAGLSAAHALQGRPGTLLLDEGRVAPERRRDSPEEVLHGVGGAGLFSDGKHSLYPSASALWSLPDAGALALAFAQTAAVLRQSGVDPGPLPAGPPPAEVLSGAWQEKRYPSLYVPFAARLACIEALWAQAPERWAGARVVDAARDAEGIRLEVERDGARQAIHTRALIVATGRWSPRWLQRWLAPLGVRFAFRRVEFGVRLETRADHALFAGLPGVDGKLRWREPGQDLEFRTFCTCRDGEVVLGRAGGLQAYSGRADGPKTGRSNVGLVARSGDAALGDAVLGALARAQPVQLELSAWTSAAALAPVFGATGAEVIWRGLSHLVARCPELRREPVRVHAPCLEGVGDYPVDDGSLQVAPGVWVAGDAGGRFRGIVASMVSGRYAALRLSGGTR